MNLIYIYIYIYIYSYICIWYEYVNDGFAWPKNNVENCIIQNVCHPNGWNPFQLGTIVIDWLSSSIICSRF